MAKSWFHDAQGCLIWVRSLATQIFYLKNMYANRRYKMVLEASKRLSSTTGLRFASPIRP